MARGNNGGGFFRGDEGLSAFREHLGDELFARWQRSRALHGSPRPLSDAERAVLRAAVAPLLADLTAAGLPLPDIREEAHEERQLPSVCAWIQGPNGTGEGIYVLLDSSPASRIAELAEQLQEYWIADLLHDAGLPPGWPTCPRHANTPHELDPQVRDGSAVWVCFESDLVISPIGDLPRSRQHKRP